MPQAAHAVEGPTINRSLRPICPRDGRVMTYEASGIAWRDGRHSQALASYHCGFTGCSVRYTPEQGYFTVVDVPDLPYFLEEPGVNLVRCPVHLTWLSREGQEGAPERRRWRCGSDSCSYVRFD